MRTLAPSLAFFRAENCASAEANVLTIDFSFFVFFLCPAVQPAHPLAPGHGPGTNQQKALEKRGAVCYLAGGPCGSPYWAQREKYCGYLPFVGDLVCAN